MAHGEDDVITWGEVAIAFAAYAVAMVLLCLFFVGLIIVSDALLDSIVCSRAICEPLEQTP